MKVASPTGDVVKKRLAAIEDGDGEIHGYMVVAQVDRKTWPLTRVDWEFVKMLQDQEAEELKGKKMNKF